VPIETVPNPHNEAYLQAKRERLGHGLHHQGLPLDEQLLFEEHRRDEELGRVEKLGGKEGETPDYPPGD